jgi:predicted PurR-regulated permease PerM
MKVKLPVNRYLTLFQYIFFVSAILYFGSPLFIPLSFALLISCVLYPVCVWLEKHKFSRMSAIALSMLTLTIFFITLLALLISQVKGFYSEWPLLQTKFLDSMESLSVWLNQEYNFSKEQQTSWITKVFNESGMSLMSVLGDTLAASAVWAVLLILIPIYAILILYYRHRWVEVLYRLFPSQGRDRIREILQLSIQSYYNFIKGMLIVYLIVGVLNSTGLYILGIPHPFLFGFIASVLTFIPYVGILVASLLPISMAWITYNSIWYPIGVVAIFALVQYLEANVIFPLAVSSRLKINTMVTIMVIIAGGLIWGVSGMILFVPFLGILKLVADRTPDLKTLSIILGEKE